MKYLKYGFYAVVKKPLFNILIMIEIAAILVVGNMAVSVFNSRAVLYDPYKDLISQDGYMFIPRAKFSNYDEDLTIKKVYDSLKGDVTVVNFYGSQIVNREDSIVSNIYIIDDRVFSKTHLPLLSGRWASSERNSAGQIEVVATEGEDGFELGTVFNSQYGEMIVVGIIGLNSYVPSITNFSYTEHDVRSFYDIVDSDDIEKSDFYVSSAVDDALSDPHYLGRARAFIYYNTEPSDEIRAYNEELLMGNSSTLYELSDINEASLEYLNEQYIKLIPILLCVFIIVLAELICSVAMNTRSQMRNYGIYFLCGCRWKGCLKISLSYSAIILVGGAVLGTIAFLLFQASEYAALFEQNLAVNNIYITLAIIALMLVLSLIIPFFQVQKTSPVETVKENR